jgi:hypothetical protein
MLSLDLYREVGVSPETIRGRRYLATFSPPRKLEMVRWSGDDGDPVDYDFSVWTQTADAVLQDMEGGRSYVCTIEVECPELIGTEGWDFFDRVFGPAWSRGQVIDKAAHVDEVLGGLFAQIKSQLPIPHLKIPAVSP